MEFVNSTAEWDKISGSKKLSPEVAEEWDPSDGLHIMELSYFFDDSTLPLVQKIRNNKADFPSFEILLAYLQRKENSISN